MVRERTAGRPTGSLVARLILFVTLAATPGVRADVINIGTIGFDQYSSFKDATQGGADIIAHYATNASLAQFAPCFTAADIRWLQLVTSSTDTGFTPSPNRPFIDPRSDQPGGFDNLPWYDATFNNLANAQMNMNRQFGAGPYLLDTPRVNLVRGPYTFTASTLLVVQMNQMIAILGGFEWGFSIAADQTTVATTPLKAIGDTAGVRNSFNTALGLDFPGYQIKDFTQIWTTSTDTPVFAVIPEPGVLVLSIFGLLAGLPMYVARSRRRAA